MRLSLIGPGDIEFHFKGLLKLENNRFDYEIESIAEVIAESNWEIELLPDKGISLNIARVYKQRKGKRVLGAIPLSDKTFGVKHLEPYVNMKINGMNIFDDFINTENWYKHDLIKGLLGDAILYLGNSPGSNGELNYAIYLYKLLAGRKEGIEIAGKYIHPEIRAGKHFTIFVYSPFLSDNKLKLEDEEYIKKFNMRLIYVKNPGQLKDELKKFNNLNQKP